MRASDLLGADAYDPDGRHLGRIADLITVPGPDGTPVVRAALVAPRHRTRLLGYERDEVRRPWLIDRIARSLHRDVREIPWTALRLAPPPAAETH
jgi:sporulation protein YlmC with PRC-barrel domain